MSIRLQTKWLWVRSSPVGITKTSDIAPVFSKEFLAIQATIEFGFTLKLVRDMIRTYSQIDDTTLNPEVEYSISFSKHGKKLCLSWHYNGLNCYIFVNGVEIYNFKAKNSEINKTSL